MSRLLGKLKARREELELEAEDRMAPTGLDTKALAAARKRITAAMRSRSNQVKKGLLRELVHEIRVNGEREVFPTFKVPADAVRIDLRMAAPTGFEPVSRP